MSDFRHLIEARIRDFQRRKEAGQVRAAPESTEAPSLESQLVAEIRALRARARDEDDPDTRDGLRRRASGLETQLLVLLESTGRPLAAKAMAERLRDDE